jgi:pilus assembly protein CpaB
MVLAVLGALAVLVALVVYVNQVAAETGDKVSVWKLVRDVEAGAVLSKDDVALDAVPLKYVGTDQVRNEADAVGKVALGDMKAGKYLYFSDFVLEADGNGTDVQTTFYADIESGVAGQIQAGSRVDVLFVNTAAPQSSEASSCIAEVALENVEVVNVGEAQKTQGKSNDTVAQYPVTFSLSVSDAATVQLANVLSNEHFRPFLLLRSVGDESSHSIDNDAVIRKLKAAGMCP